MIKANILSLLNCHPEVREVVSEVRVHDLVLEQVALVQEEDHGGVVEPLVPDDYPAFHLPFRLQAHLMCDILGSLETV